jgi:hypothetical protein
MGSAAETSTFHVAMTGPGTSRTWTATPDAAAPWLTIVSPTAPQSVDGDVTYAVTENLGESRTGNITVNGKTFAVTQSGVPVGRHSRHS